MPADAAESSSSGRPARSPPSLVSYSVKGFGRRTEEWGYYTPKSKPVVVILPRSPDRFEELAEDLPSPADEPEAEVPPEEHPDEKEPKDPPQEDREKKEREKRGGDCEVASRRNGAA